MTASLEEYLKTIYMLIHKKDSARITDIAEILDYSKASVNRAVKCLSENGYINYENYGSIEMTKKGEKEAKEILKKHITLKAFLTDILDIDEKIAEEEAKSMKYAVSKSTIDKLEEYIHTIIDFSKNYDPTSEKCLKCKIRKYNKRI